MSQARGAQEPTMEEILSSIRRIISEDGKRAGDGAEPPAAEPAPVTPLKVVPPTPESAADADDVLELTEVAPEGAGEPEPLELVEEAEAPTLAEPAAPPEPAPAVPPVVAARPAIEPVPTAAPVPPPEPVPPPAPVPPIASAAPAPLPEPEPMAEPEPASEPEPLPEPQAEALEISVTPPAPEPPSRPAPGPQPSLAGSSRLISEATEIASSAALSVLAQVVQPGRGFTEEGRRMVDQIMRERLEVHLREWLDANLAGLVERIVREEIARLVERSLGGRS